VQVASDAALSANSSIMAPDGGVLVRVLPLSSHPRKVEASATTACISGVWPYNVGAENVQPARAYPGASI
jgi:hypothetical protein